MGCSPSKDGFQVSLNEKKFQDNSNDETKVSDIECENTKNNLNIDASKMIDDSDDTISNSFHPRKKKDLNDDTAMNSFCHTTGIGNENETCIKHKCSDISEDTSCDCPKTVSLMQSTNNQINSNRNQISDACDNDKINDISNINTNHNNNITISNSHSNKINDINNSKSPRTTRLSFSAPSKFRGESHEVEEIYGTTLYDKTDESLPENQNKKLYIPPIEQEMKAATETPVNHQYERNEQICEEVKQIYGVMLEDRTDLEIPKNCEARKKLYIPEIERKMIEATSVPVNSMLGKEGDLDRSAYMKSHLT